MQNIVGPTLVAMTTTFGLGAEFSRLPACSVYLFASSLHNIEAKRQAKIYKNIPT